MENLTEPIESRDALVEYLEASAKPRSAWRVGIEMETLPVREKTWTAASYSGERGVESFLGRLAEERGWTAMRENERVIALIRGAAEIHLEPGGQVELADEPHADLHGCANALERHRSELEEVGAPLGIRFLGAGLQPLSRIDEIEWVPKGRYRILAPYLKKRGGLAHGMMKQTATVQTSLDFSGEADAMEKIRVGYAMASILTAIFANSPISCGKANGFMSYRAHIWMDTDPDRCGFPPPLLSPDSTFESYVDYALDVPMLWIHRSGHWITMPPIPFRVYLERGHEGYRATWADWEIHLSSLFPEMRLKRCIELRGADSHAPPFAIGLAALAKGILYDQSARREVWERTSGWSLEERLRLHDDVALRGLRAEIGRTPVRELAREIVRIAEEGLRRNPAPGTGRRDETAYLEPVREVIIERGRSRAEEHLEKWQGEWGGDLGRYCDAIAFSKTGELT